MSYIACLLITTGLIFSLIGGIGAIRLPDFYARTHAVGILDTVGTFTILLGVALLHGFSVVSIKLMILIVLIHIANPTITHVFARAARKAGLVLPRPEQQGKSS